MSCGDNYCHACITIMFEAAITDEGRFPVRCCREEVRPHAAFLTQDIIEQYEKKRREYTTVNRTYCYSCATFLEPNVVPGQPGVCPSCEKETCTKCKGKGHDGDCPADMGLQLMLELGKQFLSRGIRNLPY
jgi:hypothetical protein